MSATATQSRQVADIEARLAALRDQLEAAKAKRDKTAIAFREAGAVQGSPTAKRARVALDEYDALLAQIDMAKDEWREATEAIDGLRTGSRIAGRPVEDAGRWLSNALALAGDAEAGLTTATIGTIAESGVAFFGLLDPRSVFMDAGPIIAETSETVGRVTLVTGTMTPAPVLEEGEEAVPEDPPVSIEDVKPETYRKVFTMSKEARDDGLVHPERLALSELALLDSVAAGVDARISEQLVNLVGAIQVEADVDNPTSLDPYVSALSQLRRGNRRASAIFMSPTSWEMLGLLKKNSTDSLEPLVSAALSATGAPEEAILGTRVWLTERMPEHYAIVARMAELLVVRRQKIEVEVDPFFDLTHSLVGVRASMRQILVVPDSEAVCVLGPMSS